MHQPDSIELRQILVVTRRWAWLIAGCVLLATIIASFVTGRMPPEYRATTTLLIAGAEDPNGTEYTTLVAAERLALTYSQMLQQTSTLQAAIAQLGLQTTPDALAKRIVVESVKDTQLIRITVKDRFPRGAALLADTVAEAFMNRIKLLQTERRSSDSAIAQSQLDTQLALVQQTEAKLDQAAARNIAEETEVARLQDSLASLRADYNSLRRDEQALQLARDQVVDKVKVVEPTQILAARPSFPCTATLTLLVDPAPAAGEAYSDILAGERLAGTYAQILVGRPVLKAALAKIGDQPTLDDLARRVRADPVQGTQLIRLSVWGQDPGQVQALADAVGSAFISQIQELLAKPYTGHLTSIRQQLDQLSTKIDQTQADLDGHVAQHLQAGTEWTRLGTLVAEYRSDYRTHQQNYEQMRSAASQVAGSIVISERATVPSQPVGGRGLYVLIAAFAAVLVGLGAAFVLEFLDETIKTPDEIAVALDLPMVAAIGRFDTRDAELVMMTQPRSPASEAFRVLAANIRQLAADGSLRTLLVTSSAPGEGKSVVVANLAIALTQAGLRVIAVDADMRAPRLGQLFGLKGTSGLSAALRLGSVDGNLQRTRVEGLAVLAGGALPVDPVKELSSPRTTKVLAELTSMADLVVVDSPPLMIVADSTILARASDAALLVVRAGQARSRAVRAAAEALRQANERIVGFVLNGVASSQYGYNSYYAYGDHTHSDQAAGARQRFGLGDRVKRWFALR